MELDRNIVSTDPNIWRFLANKDMSNLTYFFVNAELQFILDDIESNHNQMENGILSSIKNAVTKVITDINVYYVSPRIIVSKLQLSIKTPLFDLYNNLYITTYLMNSNYKKLDQKLLGWKLLEWKLLELMAVVNAEIGLFQLER